eukprot:762059-Rhodomonas_salina.1
MGLDISPMKMHLRPDARSAANRCDPMHTQMQMIFRCGARRPATHGQRRSDAMRSDAIRCSEIRSDAMRCDPMWSEAIRGNQKHGGIDSVYVEASQACRFCL